MAAAGVETVHMSMLTILARHLERRGCDLTDWRRSVAIPEAAADDPDARVPIETMRVAWRKAMEVSDSPTLALEVGADSSCIAHSMLGHLIAHSDTLGDAFRGLCRYFLFLSGGMSMLLEIQDETAALVLKNDDPDPELWPLAASRTLAAAFTVATGETGGLFALQRVEISFPAPAHRKTYERFFGARCVFGTRSCKLVFSRAMLDLRLLHRNPELQSFFQQRLESRTASLVEPSSLLDRLRRRLPVLIDRGLFSAADAASEMHVSLRSLHRALAAEGTTFQSELDEVRRERCFWLMNDRSQPLEQIAFACGFSDASGFHRAFRRWTGRPPGEYRAAR